MSVAESADSFSSGEAELRCGLIRRRAKEKAPSDGREILIQIKACSTLHS
jgi:hypothetical protein